MSWRKQPDSEPYRERGLSVPAEKKVGGTPMYEACFSGVPVSDLVDEFLATLLERVRRKPYGIRAVSRVQRIGPKPSWRRRKIGKFKSRRGQRRGVAKHLQNSSLVRRPDDKPAVIQQKSASCTNFSLTFGVARS